MVGDSQEIFTNQPMSESSDTQSTQSAFTNIFGDDASSQNLSTTSETTQETKTEQLEETSESTEDLFSELFSEEELKNMDKAEIKEKEEDGEELPKAKDKKYSIEIY